MRILWVLVAVHFISELPKFEFIITIFEHKYAQLPELMCFHIECSARSRTIVQYQLLYHHRWRYHGALGPLGTKIYYVRNLPPFCEVYKNGRTTVE